MPSLLRGVAVFWGAEIGALSENSLENYHNDRTVFLIIGHAKKNPLKDTPEEGLEPSTLR